jgi:enterochelin esterase-like enzyme
MPEENLMVEEMLLRTITIDKREIFSDFLERDVTFDVYLPNVISNFENLSLLLVNDGQDLPKMPFSQILENLYLQTAIEPLLCVGIYCGPSRSMEYGTQFSADYKGRGAKAGLYKKFVFDELLPFLKREYNIRSFKEKAFTGFSLGGLSALDLVWNDAHEFSKAGVFSGSLWWRRKGYDDGYEDEKDRLMHLQVKKDSIKPWLKFFIQTGVMDETADRNNNGIIDSIDDAIDLIAALKEKGYSDDQIKYVELEDGTHDVETWGRVFPEFLKWGWGLDSDE